MEAGLQLRLTLYQLAKKKQRPCAKVYNTYYEIPHINFLCFMERSCRILCVSLVGTGYRVLSIRKKLEWHSSALVGVIAFLHVHLYVH